MDPLLERREAEEGSGVGVGQGLPVLVERLLGECCCAERTNLHWCIFRYAVLTHSDRCLPPVILSAYLSTDMRPLIALIFQSTSQTQLTIYSGETPSKRKTAGSKVMRKWGDSSSTITDSDMAALDFSSPAAPGASVAGADGESLTSAKREELVSREAMGKRGKDGLYDVADLDAEEEADDDDIPVGEEDDDDDDDVDAMINRALAKSRIKTAAAAASKNTAFSRRPMANDIGSDDLDEAGNKSKKEGTMSGWFTRLTGGKVLSKEDLAPVLEAMEKHLMGKNVAKDIAEKMCEGVEKALVGRKLGSFSSESSLGSSSSSSVSSSCS